MPKTPGSTGSSIRSLLKDRPRAQELLGELEARFQGFCSGLPSPLEVLARQKRAYVSAVGDEQLEGLSEINPLIACAPWMFWELFQDLSGEQFLNIAEPGAYLALASGVIDKLVDGQADPLPNFALLHDALVSRAFLGYRNTFDSGSAFWDEFDRLTREYRNSLVAETRIQMSPGVLDFEEFASYTGGKVLPLLVSVAGMCEAAGQRALLEPIESSFRMTFVAGQIHDDILDWAIDLADHHVTYFLHLLAPEGSLAHGNWPTLEILSAVNNTEWVDVDGFDLAIQWYDHAENAVRNVNCPIWRGYLATYRDVARRDQRSAAARHLSRSLVGAI